MARLLSPVMTMSPAPPRPPPAPQAPRRVPARLLLVLGLLVGDIALANLAFVLAYWVRYDLRWAPPVGSEFVDVPLGNYTGPQILVTAILVAVFLWRGLYRQRRSRQWLDEVASIVTGSTFGFSTLIVLFFILRPEIGIYSRTMILYPWLGVVVLLSAFRLVVRTVIAWRRRRGRDLRRVLVVGAGTRGKMVMQQIEQHPGLGYRPVGFLDDVYWAQRADFGRFRGLGAVEDLPQVAAAQQIDEVIVALPGESHETILGTLDYCAQSNIGFKLVPDLFELTLGDVEVDNLAGIPLIGVRDSLLTGLNLGVKRALDVVIASVALLLMLPLSLLLIIAIRLESAGPFLLPQHRIGRDRRPFRMFKFRSMFRDAEQQRAALEHLNEAEGPLFKIRDDPRVTKVGKIMRRFSLDELPQLWNVLRGEMSLVGPRAPLAGEVEQYDAWQTRRLAVTPGLTGLWQVSGRSELSFDEMVMLDFYYIENWSIGLDVKILTPHDSRRVDRPRRILAPCQWSNRQRTAAPSPARRRVAAGAKTRWPAPASPSSTTTSTRWAAPSASSKCSTRSFPRRPSTRPCTRRRSCRPRSGRWRCIPPSCSACRSPPAATRRFSRSTRPLSSSSTSPATTWCSP